MTLIEKAMSKIQTENRKLIMTKLLEHLPDMIRMVQGKINTTSLHGMSSEQQQEFFDADPNNVPRIRFRLFFSKDLENWNYVTGSVTTPHQYDFEVDLMVSLTDTPEVVARGIYNDVEEAIGDVI